ncbi:unnamed protein product [Cuscuta campestris]|uniref:DUF8039 domain-containing protein n=1 Tax=Cuscuta campestris TaxID=132261 RepID=A0A484MLN4_9ASTE|nr:unnamed protein product [Cuscuta campestris]
MKPRKSEGNYMVEQDLLHRFPSLAFCSTDYIVKHGLVFPHAPGDVVHGVLLLPHQVKVIVTLVLLGMGEYPNPCPTENIETVADCEGSFVAWPKSLVGLGNRVVSVADTNIFFAYHQRHSQSQVHALSGGDRAEDASGEYTRVHAMGGGPALTTVRIDVKFIICNLSDHDRLKIGAIVALEILRFRDIVLLNCTENMNTGKTHTYFSSLPRILPRYDYVMKADDDVYLRMERLATSLDVGVHADVLRFRHPLPQHEPFRGVHVGDGVRAVVGSGGVDRAVGDPGKQHPGAGG